MRPHATAKRLREAEAPPPPPPSQPPAPPPPPPPPPNPRVTKDNPAGIRFQDGGFIESAKDAIQNVGDYWSGDNAAFEAGNPGVGQRVMRAVNPMTGFGSAIGAVQDAAGSGDLVGTALAGAAALPPFAAARALKVAQPVAQGALARAGWGNSAVAPVRAETAKAIGRNTAVGTAADYYEPQPPRLRFQDGGHVPGTGRGDKIPAKYEPGEFVVSNDMIDDNPGLREQLAGLRAETLAARGKTVAEADAKALNGGRRPSLRADSGGAYDPLDRMAKDLTGQNSLPPKSPVGNMADELARNARAAPPAPPPGPANPGMANPQARAAYAEMARGSAPAAAPTAPAAGPGAAYGAGRQAGQVAGAAKDWALGSRPAATTVLGKVGNGVGAGLTAAGRAAGGLQVADTLRNNFDAMQNLARGENSGVSDYLAGGVEFIGNTVASGGAALSSKFPMLGPIAAGFIGSDGASRFIDEMAPGASVLRRHGLGGESKVPGASVVPGLAEAVGAIAPTRDASARPDPRNPYADANARKIAESDARNAAADAKNAAGAPAPGGYDPNQSRPDLGYGPIGDRTKLTNEQAAIMNPAGRVTMTRGANGNMEFSGGDVSGQVSYNDASGKALPGGGLRGKGFSNFDVAPAGADVVMGPGGYAFATSGSGVGQNQGSGSAGSGYTSDGIDTRGLRGPQADRYAAEVRQARAINQAQSADSKSYENRLRQWNDPFSEAGKARRSLEMALNSSGSSMLSRKERLIAREGHAKALEQFNKEHFGMAAGDRDDATRRHTSDNSLRGSEASAAATRYSADAQLGAKQMEMQHKLRQQQLMGDIYRAAGGDPVKAAELAASYGIDPKQFADMAGAQQTRAKANSEDAQSTFKGLFTDKDNKRDEHAEAQAHQLASQIVPGWENMNPEQRNANRAKVVDATRAVQGMNKLRNNGWLQAAGWDKPTPEYSQLPDLDGATIGDVGFLEGAARKDVGKNDIKITLRNGENRFIPAGTLSEAQLRMLQDNGATRSTR